VIGRDSLTLAVATKLSAAIDRVTGAVARTPCRRSSVHTGASNGAGQRSSSLTLLVAITHGRFDNL
jgi:hypothetical protein